MQPDLEILEDGLEREENIIGDDSQFMADEDEFGLGRN
jgi:hypothetical protein